MHDLCIMIEWLYKRRERRKFQTFKGFIRTKIHQSHNKSQILESLGKKYNFGMTVFRSANFNHNPIYYDLNLSYSIKYSTLNLAK